jgi:Thioesterase-like superfamily
MAEAFYLPDGEDRFLATELTRGPWDPRAQHAGPPAALLGRAVERFGGRADLRPARVTFEIARPVPIGALEVAARRLRDGRSVDLVEAALTAEGAEVMRATALRIRGVDLPLPPGLGEAPRLPGPDQGRPAPFFPTGQEVGYHTAMEWRFVAGSFLEPGPATVWLRMRHPLLPGEPPSPLVRVLAAADSGNGVSAALD